MASIRLMLQENSPESAYVLDASVESIYVFMHSIIICGLHSTNIFFRWQIELEKRTSLCFNLFFFYARKVATKFAVYIEAAIIYRICLPSVMETYAPFSTNHALIFRNLTPFLFLFFPGLLAHTTPSYSSSLAWEIRLPFIFIVLIL